MSLEETKQLLRTYRIVPNRVLGQNFMVEPTLFNKLCTYASLGKADVVLDAGAGFGFLSRFLADKCRAVIAVEKDQQVAGVLREQLRGVGNVTVVEGDVLKIELPLFTKVVAIPPYYLSSHIVTWLFQRRIECAVMILQTEFANRLVAEVGSEDYGWLTVLCSQHAAVELLDSVSKEMFYPQPIVDSVIVRLKLSGKRTFEVKDEALFVRMVKWLFTQRNKKTGKAIAPFLRSALQLSKQEATARALALPFHDRRVRELSPKQFGELADVITR